MTVNQMFTHSTMHDFANLSQVVVVYEYHVGVGFPLYISFQDQTDIRNKNKT